MTGFEVYCYFVAIRNHFRGNSYDFAKYGPAKVKISTYMARKDRYMFEKLAKKVRHEDMSLYIAANMLNNPKLWITDMFEKECIDVFYRRKKVHDSLRYSFEQDIHYLHNYCQENGIKFPRLFTPESDGSLPKIIKLVLSNSITIETVVILERILKFSSKYSNTYDVLWKEYGERYLKFHAFVPSISCREYATIVLNTFRTVDTAAKEKVM